MAGPSVCLGQMKSNTEAVFCLKVGDPPAKNTWAGTTVDRHSAPLREFGHRLVQIVDAKGHQKKSLTVILEMAARDGVLAMR